MPAFGFSVGDFIAVIELCGKIAKALKSVGGSASDYQNVVFELESLQHVLSYLQALQPNASNVSHVNAIRGMALACRLPLQDFLTKIQRYETTMGAFASHSVKGVAIKTKWALFVADHVQKLRAMVSARVLSITLLLNTHTSEAVSRLESRGGRQHSDLLSKMEDLSSNVGNASNEAKSTHQKLQKDFSTISGSLSTVSADIRATQSHVENVSKELSNVSLTMTSTQTTLSSLRDIGLQFKQFLSTFPGELRSLLQSILRNNVQMYIMLLNIQNTVSASPSDQGSSKIRLEDALGVIRELPYEWFRHWEPFEGLLQAQLKESPATRKVFQGNYQIFHKRRPGIPIDKNEWTQSISPGSDLLMLIELFEVNHEGSCCPRPSCSSKQSVDIRSKSLITCPECGLRYLSHPGVLEATAEERNLAIDQRVSENQIEEDTELFGDRPTPLDTHEGLSDPLDVLRNGHEGLNVGTNEESELSRHVENTSLDNLPGAWNHPTLGILSRPADVADHAMTGNSRKILARNNNQSSSTSFESEILKLQLQSGFHADLLAAIEPVSYLYLSIIICY